MAFSRRFSINVSVCICIADLDQPLFGQPLASPSRCLFGGTIDAAIELAIDIGG